MYARPPKGSLNFLNQEFLNKSAVAVPDFLKFGAEQLSIKSSRMKLKNKRRVLSEIINA